MDCAIQGQVFLIILNVDLDDTDKFHGWFYDDIHFNW